jgi:hypothetical protein
VADRGDSSTGAVVGWVGWVELSVTVPVTGAWVVVWVVVTFCWVEKFAVVGVVVESTDCFLVAAI